MTDIDLYAVRLVDQLLLVDELKDDTWFVTGPPVRSLPSAANLIAVQVVHHLRRHDRSNLSLKNLRKLPDLDRFPHGHFANLDAAARSSVLTRSSTDSWVRDHSFAGRSVVVVDDVRVTGANERALRPFLASLGAERVLWAYLLDLRVDPESAPSVEEPRLNSLFLDENENVAQVLSQHDIQPTTRLVWGLFAMSTDDFAVVSDAISPALAFKVVSILLREGLQPFSEIEERWRFFLERSRSSARRR